MKKYDEFVNELQGYADVYTKGLHDAQKGSFIKIGLQGNLNKWHGKIEKIDKNDRFVTTEGDVFDRNGMLYKAKTWAFQQHLKKKLKVSAMIVTKAMLLEETLTWVKKSICNNLIPNCNDPKIILDIAKLLNMGYPELEKIINDK